MRMLERYDDIVLQVDESPVEVIGQYVLVPSLLDRNRTKLDGVTKVALRSYSTDRAVFQGSLTDSLTPPPETTPSLGGSQGSTCRSTPPSDILSAKMAEVSMTDR